MAAVVSALVLAGIGGVPRIATAQPRSDSLAVLSVLAPFVIRALEGQQLSSVAVVTWDSTTGVALEPVVREHDMKLQVLPVRPVICPWSATPPSAGEAIFVGIAAVLEIRTLGADDATASAMITCQNFRRNRLRGFARGESYMLRRRAGRWVIATTTDSWIT